MSFFFILKHFFYGYRLHTCKVYYNNFQYDGPFRCQKKKYALVWLLFFLYHWLWKYIVEGALLSFSMDSYFSKQKQQSVFRQWLMHMNLLSPVITPVHTGKPLKYNYHLVVPHPATDVEDILVFCCLHHNLCC